MKKLIGSNFELDLSNYAITTTDENPWFSDTFSSKITYPFEMYLTDELDIAFGFISRTASVLTIYDVKYYEDNSISDATFEILEEEDGRLQVSFEYGLEEFPLWDTKLSDLPLEKFDLVGEDLYEHARNNVNKVWPEKNYSFPAIHSPLYSTEEEMWAYFEGQINNYQFGEFLRNEFNVEEVIEINRNIVQPLPSLMHIVNTIASASNLTLSGDILTDPNLQDNFVYTSRESFITREPVEFYIAKLASEPTSSVMENPIADRKLSTFEASVTVPKKGIYNISGVFTIKRYTTVSVDYQYQRDVKVLLGSTVIFEDSVGGDYSSITSKKFSIDVDIEVTDLTSFTINLFAESNFYLNPGESYDDYNVMDFDVIMVVEYDDITNEPIPTVAQANEIDLSKNVPDMTVGELITNLKNWHNYDYTIKGTELIFTLIQKNMGFENPVSLEEFEVKSKPRKFQQGLSFLLKFAETEDSKYTYDQVFQDVKGVVLQNFKISKTTKEIEINALPLPNDEIKNFNTAVAFENSESKLYIVRYSGLINGKNATLTPEPLLLPQIHLSNFVNWFTFRINAVAFKIVFKAFNNQVKGLTSKSKIFMYNKLHYIKSIIKTQTSPDIVEVEIDSESFK